MRDQGIEGSRDQGIEGSRDQGRDTDRARVPCPSCKRGHASRERLGNAGLVDLAALASQNRLRSAALILLALFTAAPGLSQTSTAPARQAPTRPPTTTRNTGPQFEITFDASVSAKPFTGRVYVVATKRAYLNPLETVEWFNSDPVFARDVQNWKPGETLLINSENCLAYPSKPVDLPANIYRVQAVMGLNDWAQHPIDASGNGCSEIAVFKHPVAQSPTIRLVINHKIPQPPVAHGDGIEYVRVKSELLSKFHRRDVYLEAVLALPPSYSGEKSETDRRFPAVYQIPGFDGRVQFANPAPFASLLAMIGLDAVVVALVASCPTGHHVFADSANNGPWGKALVTEFIPYLEAHYRLIPDTAARYLTGHSSGGWSSLWLQVTYPQVFGGVWSTSPDPVDFNSFMQINIYDPPESVFSNADGSQRMLSRPGFFGHIGWRALADLEEVMGRGGQLGSFEAVFSPRGPDGKPARLWDRAIGAVDRDVARAWRKYDICSLLESKWSTLGPLLAGKLHVYCGDRDDFFLEQPFLRLRETLAKLGSDAHLELVSGATHMLPPRVFNEIAGEMAKQFAALQQATKETRQPAGALLD